MSLTPLPNAFTFSNYWNGLKKIIDKINGIISRRVPTLVGLGTTINAETVGYTFDLGSTETPVKVVLSLSDVATQKTLITLTVWHQANAGLLPIPFAASQNIGVVGVDAAATQKAMGGILGVAGTFAEVYTDAATGAKIENLSYANGVYTFNINKGTAAAFSPMSIGAEIQY